MQHVLCVFNACVPVCCWSVDGAVLCCVVLVWDVLVPACLYFWTGNAIIFTMARILLCDSSSWMQIAVAVTYCVWNTSRQRVPHLLNTKLVTGVFGRASMAVSLKCTGGCGCVAAWYARCAHRWSVAGSAAVSERVTGLSQPTFQCWWTLRRTQFMTSGCMVHLHKLALNHRHCA